MQVNQNLFFLTLIPILPSLVYCHPDLIICFWNFHSLSYNISLDFYIFTHSPADQNFSLSILIIEIIHVCTDSCYKNKKHYCNFPVPMNQKRYHHQTQDSNRYDRFLNRSFTIVGKLFICHLSFLRYSHVHAGNPYMHQPDPSDFHLFYVQ